MAQEGDAVQDKISKALALASTFVSGCAAINVSQVLGAPISLINEDWYNSWIAHTKKSFAILTMTMTERWAPTKIRVSGDASMRGQLFHSSKGELLCNFPRRLVMIANHQIYTDWLYLWWIAYVNGMHGRIYIIMKESLKRIPIIGWGMQLCQFIFLKRNWEQDKPSMSKALGRLKNVDDPMWLLLFPEGTNLAPSTREASKKWADKNGIKDFKHTLLPRATGLQFCLQELDETVHYLYDCTIAYEGVPRGQYAQDIYTLQASYVEGKPPKCVNMYWRRFPVSSIPLNDQRKFELWLRARWLEKDSLIEYFHQNGQFPADTGSEKSPTGKTRRGAGHINTTIKMDRWYEFLQTFMPMGLFAMVLYSFYGALPESMAKNLGKQSVLESMGQLQQANLPQAQKDAVVKAASHATGVKSVNVQKVPNAAAKAPSAPSKSTAPKSTAQSQGAKKPAAKPQPAKPQPVKAEPAKPAATKPAAKQATATNSAPRNAPKLGPRSTGTPSAAASTTGAAPKLGPRRPSVAPSVASSARSAPKLGPRKPPATSSAASARAPANDQKKQQWAQNPDQKTATWLRDQAKVGTKPAAGKAAGVK